VQTANRSFYQTFHVPPEETTGRRIFDLGNGQWDIPALRELLEEVLPQNTAFNDFEVEHNFPLIGRKVMLLNARTVRRGGDHWDLILLAIEDITEQRQAEEANREIETCYTSLVRNVKDHAIFMMDAEGHIASWNQEAERIIGYSQAEILGRHFSIVFSPDDIQRGLPEQELRIAREDGRAEDERWHVRKDGSRFWALGIVTPMHDAKGSVSGFSKILRDMTDRKLAEEQLKVLNQTLAWRSSQLQRLAGALTQAEEQQRRRLAYALHDHLQQFLVAAKMELARTGGKVPDGGFASGVERIQNLLDEAITESRSLTAELSPPVLYDRGLAAGLEWLGRQTEEKYHLTTSVEADPAAEPKDDHIKAFVFQAARELILNAIKHGHATLVTISLANVEAGHIRLAVTDDGIGCEPEKLNPHSDPAGFGLFSIRERLDLMGGNLEITSVPGQGTKATVTAPYKAGRWAGTAGRVQSTHISSSVLPSQHTGRTRVLLVDDHPMLRKGLADLFLDQPEIDLVGEAADGQEAVEMSLQLRPDVVLMDVSMPRMDGIEATRRIKQSAPDIRIIGLSMYEAGDMESTMRNAGASDYLVKSAAPEELISVILNQCPQT
jgi:PAS domain S-box-containing protein